MIKYCLLIKAIKAGNLFIMNIQELRNEIDTINDEMLKLFIKRMEISYLIGKEKQKEGKSVLDRKREEEVLEYVVANSPQNIQNYSIEFFRNIMNLSKQYQEEYK